MKIKYTILLSAIILISGTVFYFGWIQIQLPENTYGIAFTKSNGYLEKVYEPGKFSWEVRKLIPTNFKLLKFKITSQQFEINHNQQLPNSDIYAEYLPGSPVFSYNLKYFISYKLRLETLPGFVEKYGLSPEQLPERYKVINSDIQLFISNYLINSLKPSDKILENEKNISKDIIIALNKNFPVLEIFEFIPSTIIIPDSDLYSKAKELYLSSIEMENKVISESKLKIAEQKIRDNANFETLKKYGELLTQYPELIEFFAVIDFDGDSIIPDLSLDILEKPVE
jgi:hypothetical protein